MIHLVVVLKYDYRLRFIYIYTEEAPSVPSGTVNCEQRDMLVLAAFSRMIHLSKLTVPDGT